MRRPSLPLIVALAGLAAAFALLVDGIPRAGAPPPGAVRLPTAGISLAPGRELERELRGGAADLFDVPLARGDFLHAAIEQRGLDVVVALYDPAGRELLRIDRPTGSWGPEPLSAVARSTGLYQLEVRALDAAASGRYALVIEAPRPATPGDRDRAAAVRVFDRAERLRARGEAEPLRRALDAYGAALRLWRVAGEPREEAIALRRSGQVARDLGELRTARESYAAALALYRQLDDPAQESPVLDELGTVLRLLGEPRAAEGAYQQALHLARALGDRGEEATALNNLGVLYETQAELQQALDAYAPALLAWRALGDRAREAATLHNLGAIYGVMGRLPEALDFLGRALALRRTASDRRGAAATLTKVAWIHAIEGRPLPALDLLAEALRLRRETGDRRGEAVTLDQRGTLLAHLGRRSEALASYQGALTIFHTIGDPASEADTLANLGWLYDALGRPRTALLWQERALGLFQRLGERHAEAETLLALARAERRRGALDRARARSEEALRLLESLRAEPRSPASRASYLALRYDFFELAIDLLLELAERDPAHGYAERAFEVSERARARSLLEGLAAARSRADAVPEPRERELQERLAAVEGARRRLAAEDGPREELAATDRKLRELLLAREDLRARRQVAARPAPAPLGLPEIREQVLDDDTLLLEYALGEEASRLWAVDRGSLAVFRLPPRSVLEAQARRVDGLLPRSHERGVRRQAALAAAMLSRSLLGPLAGRLGGRRLLIVADGALQSVSFAALPDPDSPAGEPLLARHEIVPLPSASVLALLRRQLAGRRPPPHRLVVIADPVFEPGDPRLPAASGLAGGAPVPAAGAPALARQGEGGRFARLPFTRREAEELLRLVPGRERLAALDFAASRETVLSGRLGRYRIVHFATHALLDDEHPELSGLVLARFDERGRPRDGLLRTYEIDDLDLPVDLVVLSACRTARGREIRGEGLLGLTRGFLHAGAARVLVSLWNVDDEATAELMRRFYRLLLGERLPASRALREAQLSLRGDPRWGAPYYWAGFTLQGEWR